MSRWFISTQIAILSWSAAPATAQSGGFQEPVAGYVHSAGSRTVRPLLGIPGAAHIGAPVLHRVDFASIAPNGKWALITKARRSFLTCDLTDRAPAESSPRELIDAVDRVVWTRDGSFALLYSSSSHRLQRVHLSAAAPVADTPLDLSPWGPVTALAIDATGDRIVFGVAGSGLYILYTGETPGLLSSMAQPAVAAFDDVDGRLFAVDLDQQQISEFDSGSSGAQFASLALPDAPMVKAVGLAVSGDGQYLVLADSAAHAVRVYDTGSGSLTNTIPLDFTPTRFETLSPAPTFLLNGDNSNEWLMILDAGKVPATFFVPANPEAAQ